MFQVPGSWYLHIYKHDKVNSFSCSTVPGDCWDPPPWHLVGQPRRSWTKISIYIRMTLYSINLIFFSFSCLLYIKGWAKKPNDFTFFLMAIGQYSTFLYQNLYCNQVPLINIQISQCCIEISNWHFTWCFSICLVISLWIFVRKHWKLTMLWRKM